MTDTTVARGVSLREPSELRHSTTAAPVATAKSSAWKSSLEDRWLAETLARAPELSEETFGELQRIFRRGRPGV